MSDPLLAAFCIACSIMLASAAVSAFDIFRLRRINARKP